MSLFLDLLFIIEFLFFSNKMIVGFILVLVIIFIRIFFLGRLKLLVDFNIKIELLIGM